MGLDAIARERRLVLACACPSPPDAQRARIAALCDAGVDWDEVDAFARRHGLLPLVFRHLSAIVPGRIPRPRYAEWWAACEELARRNVERFRELEDIVRTLAAEAIVAIPYKGPTLAMEAYGDLGLREFVDLDLLVAPSAVRRAVGILTRGGYRSALSLSSEAEQALVTRSRHYEWPLLHEATGRLVELHWRADPEYRVLDLESPPARLPPSVHALVLLLHGTKHSWSRLAWLADVAALAHAMPLDWEWISRESRRLGCVRQVALGLRLAQDLLGMPPPAPFAADVRGRVVARVAGEIARETCGESDEVTVARGLSRNFALRTGMRAKAAYAWRSLAAPGLGEWQRWDLPAPLAGLYWLLRPWRLAEKYLLRRTPPAATPRTPPPRPRSTG